MPLPIDRLHRLHDLLNEGHALTLEEIRSRLDLKSDRHVRRLVAELREKHVDVKERRDGRHKRFYLDAADCVIGGGAPCAFDEEELFATILAAQAARAALIPTPLGAGLERALEKMLETAGRSALTFEPEALEAHWFFESTVQQNIDPGVFKLVFQATIESRSIYVDYFAAHNGVLSRHRLIDPYLIAVRGTSWLVVAYCHERRSLIDFSLAGISRVEPANQYFSMPRSFDPQLHFRDRFSAMRGGDVFIVRLDVSPQKAPYFGRKIYHPTQQVEETRPDGSLIVSYEVSGLDEIAAFIRSWGPGVTVIDPPELVQRIASDALAVAASYPPQLAPAPPQSRR